MTSKSLPTLVLQGSPQERGGQHGRAFSVQIRRILALLRARSEPAAYEAARRQAARAWALLPDVAPDVVAEIRGIAEGASCNPVDLYLRIGFEFFAAPANTGCSAVAVSRPDGAIVGQNWDAPLQDHDEQALFVHTGPDGAELTMVAAIGALGWVGCNGSGLALVNNDLLLDAGASGLPSQVVRRLVLQASDVRDAISRLETLRHMGGRAYLLGDAAGRIAAVEVSPTIGARLLRNAPVLFHTNHALDERAAAVQDKAALKRAYPSSQDRLKALRPHEYRLVGVKDVMIALSDRRGAPNAVAKMVSADEPTETAFSIIMECGSRRIHLCAGPPSKDRYLAPVPPSGRGPEDLDRPASGEAQAARISSIPSLRQ